MQLVLKRDGWQVFRSCLNHGILFFLLWFDVSCVVEAVSRFFILVGHGRAPEKTTHNSLSFNFSFYFICNGVFPSCIMCIMCFPGVRGGQKRVSDSPRVRATGGCELPSVGTGNQIRVLSKSSVGSLQLSSPRPQY